MDRSVVMPAFTRLGSLLVLALIILAPQLGHANDKWTPLSFAPGWQNYGQSYQPVMAVKSDNVVTVSGLAARAGGGKWEHIATLPADMRPKQRLIFNTNTHNQNARVDVLTNGQIHFIVGNQSHDWVSLDGISFDLGSSKPLTLTSGWEDYGFGYAGAASTLSGNTVSLSGLVKTGAGNLIATLPNNLRPAHRLVFNLNSHDKVSRVDVMPDGRVLWIYKAPSRSWVSLNGITFERKAGKPLQLVQGWGKHGDAAFASANVTRVGNRVRLSGLVAGNKWGHFANLPKDMCPPHRLIFDLNNHDGSARVDVLPTCQIAWVAGAKNHGWINLDGLSFVLNPEGQQVAAVAKVETLPWIRIPGGARDIGVGANGAAWVIGENKKNDGYDIWRYAAMNKWTAMPGSGERIAVDPVGNAWTVTDRQKILYWNGNDWTNAPGEAADIDVGANGDVWIAGTDGVAKQWSGKNWTKVGGGGIARIAVEPKKGIWAIANGTQIWRYDGRAWEQIPGAAMDIGIGANGSVWVIGTDSAPYLWDGKTWIKHDGLINNLSVDPKGYVWATNVERNIWVDKRSAGYRNPPEPVVQTAALNNMSSGGGLQNNPSGGGGAPSDVAPDEAAAKTAFHAYPKFSSVGINWKQNGAALSGNVNIGGAKATAFAFTAQNNNAVVTGILADQIELGKLLNIQSGNSLVSGYKLKKVVVFLVPAASNSLSHKVSSFPELVANALKASDPTFQDANAEIVLEPGLTYFANVDVKGVVQTAFSMMGLNKMSLAGTLASAKYQTPQSVVTLKTLLDHDPLKKIMGNGFQVIKVASSAKPSLYVTLSGSTDIEVGYDSTFEVFDQVLDGKLFFAKSGAGAGLETKIAIQMSRQSDWSEPKLLPPAKLRNVVLKGTEITLARVINNTGTSTSLSVNTEETKIHGTPYKPASFSFTLEGASALPKAVFVNLKTDEITIKQMAELADVAVRLTPPGQLAGLVNPFSSVDVFDKLGLNNLPSHLIKFDEPEIYLTTPGAAEPQPVSPPLPKIAGAGVHVRGKLYAFDKKLAETKTKIDFNGLHIDTGIGTLSFGGFELHGTKFKLNATPTSNPTASFSGRTTIAGIAIASAKIGITNTGFSYDIQSACIALLKVRFKDHPTGYGFRIPAPKSEPCLADPLESLAGAIDAGMEIVGKGHQLVTAFSDDAWAGMSQSIRLKGLPITPKSIKDFSKKYSNPAKALNEVADKGKEVVDNIVDSIGGLIGGSDNRKDGPRYFIRPDDCGDRDDWNLKWGTCWRRGHELIRTEQYHGLCLSVNGRKKIKDREVQIEFCHGDWNQQWRHVNSPADTEKDVRLGSVIHGWTGEGCLETETGGHPVKIRQNGCNKTKNNQQFRRDFVDRLVAHDGRCLQIDKFADDAFIFLNTCTFEGATGRAHPNQRWLFQDGSSFAKGPPPMVRAAPNGNSDYRIKTTALPNNVCLDAPSQTSTGDLTARFINCDLARTKRASWALSDGRLESKPRGSNCLSLESDGSIKHGPCPKTAGSWSLIKSGDNYLIMHVLGNCLSVARGGNHATPVPCNPADKHALFTLE